MARTLYEYDTPRFTLASLKRVVLAINEAIWAKFVQLTPVQRHTSKVLSLPELSVQASRMAFLLTLDT